MTEKKRIAVNVLATYGRSLYTLALGLFTARWALQALGTIDFGLFGLVGGLTGFVIFFNQLLASAVGRFYAYYVGAARIAKNTADGIEECRRWFNTAFSIHATLPVLLVVIGYPIGSWMIHCFLTIPDERIVACVWVWRFTCLSCFVGMLNVPFQAMYTAKQEIAELTVYSVASATVKAAALYYMITHPGDWLASYAACVCFISVVPQLIIAVRAMFVYPECRLNCSYWGDVKRMWQLAYYAVARFWAEFASMFMNQGHSILVNKYLSAAYNASMTIAGAVSSQALTLSSAIDGAFWPVITNKAGEGDVDAVKKTCYVVFRLSTIMVLIFAVPLGLEIKEVLRIWLGNPPDFAAEICIAILVRSVLERMSVAYVAAINGLGVGVMRYSWTVGWVGVSTVFITWLFFALGFGMWSVVVGLLFSKCATVCTRLIIGRVLIGFSLKEWIGRVCAPITVLTVSSVALGMLTKAFMQASLMRIVVTTLVCEMAIVPLAWRIIMTHDERAWISSRILRLFSVHK